MAETQTITYGKPAYIEKAQQDLLTALNQYITDIPSLPEKQVTGLSDTQKFAIEQLKTGLGQYDPTLTAAQDAFTSGVASAGTAIPDFLTQGQQYLSDAASMKFDPSSAGQYMNEYQKYVIDESNKQAGLADKKADDAATQRGTHPDLPRGFFRPLRQASGTRAGIRGKQPASVPFRGHHRPRYRRGITHTRPRDALAHTSALRASAGEP